MRNAPVKMPHACFQFICMKCKRSVEHSDFGGRWGSRLNGALPQKGGGRRGSSGGQEGVKCKGRVA